MINFFINLLAVGTLLSGILTITNKNPVISVIFLILTFVEAAGYLILIGIQFLGISYIVIYVGAIAVLFLFVIMMINIKLTDILETGSQYTKNLPLAISIGSLFLFIIFSLIPYNLYNAPSLLISLLNNFNYLVLDPLGLWPTALSSSLGPNYSLNVNNYIELLSYLETNSSLFINNNDFYVLDFQQIEILGHSLYTYGSILLIILSFILLLAMFATIIISKKK